MKSIYKFGSLCLLTLICISLNACYEYEKDIEYAHLKGTFVDKFTNTKLDVGNITMEPSAIVNGTLNIDTAGVFNNTRIMPGDYSVYGSINAAFTSDSTKVQMIAGITAEIKLEIEPFISITSSVVQILDTTVTVRYTIQGNKGVVPARHVVAWSTSPKPTVSSQPGGSRNYYTPSAGQENGTFDYKITGLKWGTIYYIVIGARITDAVINANGDYNYARQIIIETPKKK